MEDIVNLKGGKQDWKNYGSNLVGGDTLPYKLYGRWLYSLLTEWEGWTGKYLAWGHGIYIKCSEVCASWPQAKHFPIRPDLSQSITILSYIFITPNFIGKSLKGKLKCAHAKGTKLMLVKAWTAFSRLAVQPYTCQLANAFSIWLRQQDHLVTS